MNHRFSPTPPAETNVSTGFTKSWPNLDWSFIQSWQDFDRIFIKSSHNLQKMTASSIRRPLKNLGKVNEILTFPGAEPNLDRILTQSWSNIHRIYKILPALLLILHQILTDSWENRDQIITELTKSWPGPRSGDPSKSLEKLMEYWHFRVRGQLLTISWQNLDRILTGFTKPWPHLDWFLIKSWPNRDRIVIKS